MQIDFHLSQINDTAKLFWQKYHQYKIWAFNAPMGAGKTTFIHALCDVIKIKSTAASPTFAIINEYESAMAGAIYHMDWYRLKDKIEIMQSGCEDFIESGNFCFIEWADKAPDLLPANTLYLSLEIINAQERRLTAKPFNS